MTSMMAILAGGPDHGKRITNPGSDHLETVAVAKAPLSALDHVITRPRPIWWKDPIGWWQWTQPEPPTWTPGLEFTKHLYTRNGSLKDGTAVYWHQGVYQPPPENARELAANLYEAMERCHPADRTSAHWEMGSDWHGAIRRHLTPVTPGGDDYVSTPQDLLLSYPVRVSAGAPRLTPDEAP